MAFTFKVYIVGVVVGFCIAKYLDGSWLLLGACILATYITMSIGESGKDKEE